MGNGWKLIAYPGGPGLAFLGSADWNPGSDGHKRDKNKELLLKLAGEAYRTGAAKFIGLTDGTGKGAKGAALIQEGRDYILWSLEV